MYAGISYIGASDLRSDKAGQKALFQCGEKAQQLVAVDGVVVFRLMGAPAEERAEQTAAHAASAAAEKTGQQTRGTGLALGLHAAEHAHQVGEVETVGEIHLRLAGNGSRRAGKTAQKGGSHRRERGADIAGVQPGLLGKVANGAGGLIAEDMADDFAAVFGIGLVDLFGEGALVGVLAESAEQGQCAGLGRGVVGHELDKQGNGQGNQLFQDFRAEAGLFRQRGNAGVGEHGFKQ